MEYIRSHWKRLIQRGTPLIHGLRLRYARLFSIDEIEQSTLLQWFFGAMLLDFFVLFNSWIYQPLTTTEGLAQGLAICPSYFQQCSDFFFLHYLPIGYSQTIFYMALYGIMLLTAYYMWKKDWVSAHALMLILFLWKALVMIVFSDIVTGGANYHHLFLTFVLLFVPHKEVFLQITFILLYFVSTAAKVVDTWVLGTYFTSLQTGLPIFGNTLAPLFTNLVIFMEIVGAWFLMSKHAFLQRGALFFFVLFHLYAGVFVGYQYPIVALPALVILFGPLFARKIVPLSRASIGGWCVLIFLLLIQLPGPLIEGDQRYTREGSRYGLNLFDANHQCVITYKIYEYTSAPVATTTISLSPRKTCNKLVCEVSTKKYMENALAVTERRFESPVSWQRCSAYQYWQRMRGSLCTLPSVERISMQLDHSINGGPFYRVVNEGDICHLSYSAFSHNDWVHSPPQAQVVGYPVKNIFRYRDQGMLGSDATSTTYSDTSDLIVLHELRGNDPVTLEPLQKILLPYLNILVDSWILTAFVTVLFLLRKVFKDWRNRNEQ